MISSRPRRDDPLEVQVLDGVVFDADGGMFHVRIERRSPGHGPAHQHAADLEPQVVVQPPGPVQQTICNHRVHVFLDVLPSVADTEWEP